MKRGYIIIPFVIYPFDVLVSTQNNRDLIKTLKSKLSKHIHKEIQPLDADCKGRATMFSSGQSVIHLRQIDAGTIAHEAFHVVFNLMDRLETPLISETDEVYAYLLGYIVSEIHKWLKIK